MNFFTSAFSSTLYSNPEHVVEYVINKNLQAVKNYDGIFKYVRDSQKNNLLHLATLNEDIEMIKYLISQGVEKNHLNRFNQTPYDYAIKTHNKTIINLLSSENTTEYNNLKAENQKLQTQKDTIKIENQTLAAENKNLKRSNESLNNEVVSLKSKNKRLREENTMLSADLQAYKMENEELVQANKKLKVSVDSLTDAMRK